MSESTTGFNMLKNVNDCRKIILYEKMIKERKIGPDDKINFKKDNMNLKTFCFYK